MSEDSASGGQDKARDVSATAVPAQQATSAANLSPTAVTKAPWASNPGIGSHIPQLARPDPAKGVVSSRDRADTMSPSAAPWAAAPVMGPPSSQSATGRPVQGLIQAEPQMPKLQAPTNYKAPAKLIQNVDDLKRFLSSNAVKVFVGFIMSLNQAVTGRQLNAWLYCVTCLWNNIVNHFVTAVGLVSAL
eukprot:GHRR01020152.1.p1 GENE.GHRR01020152.1~~GHRR01020152.1.p1  ORF type:complete len:189 (+),score=58.27 GHRR01020152.1:238-804(+)